MQEFAVPFYGSRAWKTTRRAYRKSKGGLCERCLAKGLIKPGEIVHHKTHLTPENISDPMIALSWDNLELVCRECHSEIHEGAGEMHHRPSKKRWKVDKYGTVIVR